MGRVDICGSIGLSTTTKSTTGLSRLRGPLGFSMNGPIVVQLFVGQRVANARNACIAEAAHAAPQGANLRLTVASRRVAQWAGAAWYSRTSVTPAVDKSKLLDGNLFLVRPTHDVRDSLRRTAQQNHEMSPTPRRCSSALLSIAGSAKSCPHSSWLKCTAYPPPSTITQQSHRNRQLRNTYD
jgi:hypothetical protein